MNGLPPDGADWSTPRQGPGVRRNALDAPHWAALVEVDPRVADALLGTLEDAGVAAYAEPVGEIAADRVYVDTSRREVAEAVVAAELPGLIGELEPATDVPDDLSAFEAIVAGWDAEPGAPVPPWPVEEDLLPDRIFVARLTPIEEGPPPDDEGHYVPPPPPPVPEAHPVTRWAAIAVAFGLVLLIGLPLLATAPSQAAQVFGALCVVGGIGTLVWRMRDGPSVDDGPDDGAVL